MIRFVKKFKYAAVAQRVITHKIVRPDGGVEHEYSLAVTFLENGFGKRKFTTAGTLGPGFKFEDHHYLPLVVLPWLHRMPMKYNLDGTLKDVWMPHVVVGTPKFGNVIPFRKPHKDKRHDKIL